MKDGLAITASSLSKSYRIRHRHADTPTRATEALMARVRHPFRRDPIEEFHALSDVDFEIPQGEAVGIVGRNGAGKSTLLKLLTRVTAPSAGRIELRGRVGSLLEVGTGFHPELTGRENIYLNGTLLGMRAKEIRRQFDDIVEFSGIERFLDTPVKRFSSGMYVRLAFAVAAHLEGGDPRDRRGPGRRRLRVPGTVAREDAGRGRGRPHRPVRQPPAQHRQHAVQLRDVPAVGRAEVPG